MAINENTKPVRISIIIPFYDSEDYVARCLDSVLSQDMPDFEIIAVNDGSPDSTPSLLEEYAKKDCRVKVVHLKNGGSGWARNQGVLRAGGEYLMFIDGDDFILPGCLSEIYNYTRNNNADVVVFSYVPWQNGVFGEPKKYSYPKDELMDAVTAAKVMLLDSDAYIWNKIIRRTLYMEKNICFAEGMLLEDIPVSCAMLLNSKRIFYLDNYFYAYVIRDKSIMHLPITVRRTRDIIHCYKLVMEEIRKTGHESELADVFDCSYVVILVRLLQVCYSSPQRYKSSEELKDVKTFLEGLFSEISIKNIFSNKYLKLSYKVKAVRLKSGIYKLEKAITRVLGNE